MAKSKTGERHFIEQLQAGHRVEDQVFLVREKSLRTASNGRLFIRAVLADRTGQMPAMIWDASEAMFAQMAEGGFVRLKGRVEDYKGNNQFVVDAMRPVPTESVDLAEFVPASEHDIEAMWNRLLEILRGIKSPPLLSLVKQFVTDEALVAAVKRSPAARQLHHAYLGGLLEHTLAMAELALVVVPKYPQLSMDLMLAGIFLHDIAKSWELASQTSFDYTDGGELVGHLVKGAVWIEQRAAAAAAETGQPFPEDLLNVLQHIILSHHGQYEFGSPKLPAVPEAIAIHHLDNLDAKLNLCRREIDSDPDAGRDFTDRVWGLDNIRLYKKRVLESP